MFGFAFMAVVTAPLVVIDVRERRLPNRITLPAIAVVFASLSAAATWSSDWLRFWIAVVWGAGGFVVGLLLNLRGMLGMGDVKLLAALLPLLGWLGAETPLYGLLAAFTAAALVLLVRFGSGRLRLDSTLAMGPYLLGGFWLVAAVSWAYSLG